MSYTNLVQTIPLFRLLTAIERRLSVTGVTDEYGTYEEVEHYFYTTKSGVVIDIQPQKGIARKIISTNNDDNAYPEITYSWKANTYLINNGSGNRSNTSIYEYDPVTGKVRCLDMSDKLSHYEGPLANSTNTYISYNSAPLYFTEISTDGGVFGSNYVYRGSPSVWYYNPNTREIEWYNKYSYKKLDALYGQKSAKGIKVDNSGAFDGVYGAHFFTDEGVNIFSTIETEAAANNIVFKGWRYFFLHHADRAVGSSTRRVICRASISSGTTKWYVIDVKSPTNFYISVETDEFDVYDSYSSKTWEDQSSASIATTNWSKSSDLTTYNAETSYLNPEFDLSIFYSKSKIVGRFGYNYSYVANKSYYYCLPHALEDGNGFLKGDMIFPTNWTETDWENEFLNNGNTLIVCKANLGGVQGFSSEDEYVGFFQNQDKSSYGYIRPDNYEFVEYNYVSDPSGFIVESNIDTTQGEFGCWLNRSNPVQESTTEIDGDLWYTDTGFSKLKSAINTEQQVELFEGQKSGNINFEVLPDKDKPWQRYSIGVESVCTTYGDLLNIIEASVDVLAVSGVKYSGLLVKERQGDDSLDPIKTFPNVISYKGVMKYSDVEIYYYGYLGATEKLDLTNYPNLTSADYITEFAPNTICTEQNYMTKFDSDFLLISGTVPRSSAYKGSYGCVGYYRRSDGDVSLFPGIPNNAAKNINTTVRTTFGLTGNSYSDSVAEDIFAASIITQGLTRLQGISALEDTCMYGSQGVESYGDGDKFIINLQWLGIGGLIGFRINEQADGLGTWHDENSDATGEYPKCIFVNKADGDLSTLQASDYKYVTFNEAGLLNKGYCGRTAISTNYIAFLDHDHASGNAVVRVISKTNLETAANGTGTTNFDATYNVALGNNNGEYGFGSEHQSFYNFTSVNGVRNAFFTIGDDLYVSVSIDSGSPYAAIIKIDLSDGTQTIWCTDTVKQASRSLTYNSTTNTAFVTRDKTAFRITNFTGLSAPYALS